MDAPSSPVPPTTPDEGASRGKRFRVDDSSGPPTEDAPRLPERPPEPRPSTEPPSLGGVGKRRAGSLIGSPRIVHERRFLRSSGSGRFRATAEADTPLTPAQRMVWTFRRWLFGQALSSEVEMHERLSKKLALAVFASDALSSTAYATEEILLVLVLAGTAYMQLAIPVAAAITLLLVIVVMSYRQTVCAYPGGGSSYIVASENLGPSAGLLAAAAILSDYVLTVAVSISAGTLAIVSALPFLGPFSVEIALLGLGIVTIMNLRGAKESGTVFAIPTYLFIVMFALLIAVGLGRLAFGSIGPIVYAPSGAAEHTIEALGILLILRAFASGATALTGVEAIADGVSAFRPPEWRNASTTLLWMAAILATFFMGVTVLATQLGVMPQEGISVIAQMARAVFAGATPLYYLFQASTALILFLAANTAFNDFPRVAAILARDRYMPRRFALRGDRLTFSLGIFMLTGIAAFVLVIFQADTHRLIPLYAIGVFVAFTLSQSGMVMHWWRAGRAGFAMLMNGTGAVATGVVLVVVSYTKFSHGAWVVMILMPAIVLLLRAIHKHYLRVEADLALDDVDAHLAPRPTDLSAQPVIVPVRELNIVTWNAIEYARRMSKNVVAAHVQRDDHARQEAFIERWNRLIPDVPLVTIDSPYRTFIGPFMAYADRIADGNGGNATIVVPEFKPDHWWESLLHNRTGRLIEDAAEDHPKLAVTILSVRLPKHIERE